MKKLKPCPCGETPERLVITAEHDRPKWAYCSGDCCGVWEVEFRNQYHQIHGEETMALAIEAWNHAPRVEGA